MASSLAVAATGLMSQSLEEDLPATFQVAEPHVGDRAVYAYSLRNASDGTLLGGPVPYYQFELPAPEPFWDESGRGRLVQGGAYSFADLQYIRYNGSEGGTEEFTWQHTGWMHSLTDRATQDFVGMEVDWEFNPGSEHRQDVLGYGLVQQSRESETLANLTIFSEPSKGSAPWLAGLCGMVHPMQGQTVDPNEPMRVPQAACWIPLPPSAAVQGHPVGQLELECIFDPDCGESRHRLSERLAAHPSFVAKAVGTQHVGGKEALVLQHGPTGLMLWYTQEVPYPQRLAWPENDRVHVVDLVDFERGDQTLAKAAASRAPPADLGPVRLAPLEPWGPNDTGADIPYPPSQAWRAALNDGALDSWLQDHPHAVLQSMEGDYGAWTELFGDDYEITWRFRLVDDAERFAVDVTARKDASATSLAGLGAPPEPLRQAPEVTVEHETERLDEPAVEPDAQLPEQVPVASDLQTHLLARLSVDALYGPVWSLDLSCTESTEARNRCAAYGYEAQALRVVVDLDANPSSEPPGVETTTRLEGGRMEFQAHGSAGLLLQEDAWARSVTGPQVLDKDRIDPYSEPDDGSPAAWGWPTETALASAGLLGLLLGALYYFWPTLKSACAPLFTRVRPDKLLDHPTRRAIHDAVAAEPGIHLHALCRRLEKARGVVDHHVAKLVEGGRLLRHEAGGYACLFPRRTDRRVMAAAPALRSPSARRLLDSVCREPGMAPSLLAHRLGLNRATVHHHLRRLEEAGLVSTRPSGRGSRVEPTAFARQVPIGPP